MKPKNLLFSFMTIFTGGFLFGFEQGHSGTECQTIGRFSYQDNFDKYLINKILNNAPTDIKRIVFNLMCPPRSSAAIPKRLLLIGEPGTGKTSLAKAIALKCCCEYYIIEAPFLLNEYKNCGQQNLLREIVPLLERGKPIVLIIDEITELTNKHDKNDNADATVISALWLLLDLCAQYDNVFFIGTSNKTRKDLPAQLLSRFDEDIITISVPNNVSRMAIIEHCLRFERCDIDQQYKNYLVHKTKGRSVREIEKLVYKAIQFANVYPSSNYVVLQKHFDKALRLWRPLWHPQVLYERNQAQLKFFFGTAFPIVLQAITTFTSLYFGIKQELRASKQMALHKSGLMLQEQSCLLQREGFELQKDTAAFQKELQEKGYLLQMGQTGISAVGLAYQIIPKLPGLGLPI